MPIPEYQLDTWSNPGATIGSSDTYSAVKRALDLHTWPREMAYQVYLQGSYANSTNIRGNSDVDIVVECTSIYYHNLNDIEQQQLRLSPAQHSYEDFRQQLINALTNHFGSSYVDASGANAVEVLPYNNRLKADVLHCHTYRRYNNLQAQADGITFFNRHTWQQIINYPKQHISNGEAKNGLYRTNSRYKRSVRMFKNARERIIQSNDQLRRQFPSYFVECLFYNVPDAYFTSYFQSTFTGAVSYLSGALSNGQAGDFTTQSGQQWLFGSDSVQWSQENARDFVARLNQLWSTYY
jgi:predicted nucleotidyltransferase